MILDESIAAAAGTLWAGRFGLDASRGLTIVGSVARWVSQDRYRQEGVGNRVTASASATFPTDGTGSIRVDVGEMSLVDGCSVAHAVARG